MALNPRAEQLLDDSRQRVANYRIMQASAEADVKLLLPLVEGKYISTPWGDIFKIASLGVSYNGAITVRGRKLLSSGEPGKCETNLGTLTASRFVEI